MVGFLPPAAPSRPLSRGFDVILAPTLGALQTLSYVSTEAWWLQMLCIGLLGSRAAVVTPRRAAALGWCLGTAWLAVGTLWLFISMHRYGGLPAWMAAAAVLALSGFLSLYLSLAMLLFARWRRGRVAADALLFAALWLLAELARGVIFTGFPWVAAGYAHVDGPLAAAAPWIGVYGIGALAAGLSAGVSFSLLQQRRRWLGAAVALAAIGLGAALSAIGPQFTRPTGTLTVTLLQGNIPQEQKFQAEHQGPALQWHVETMLQAQSDLVIAPETAVPFLPQQMPEDFWPSLRARFASGRTH